MNSERMDLGDLFDPDRIPRAVLAFGGTVATDGLELDFHHHRKGQLLLGMRGSLTCEVASGLWLVPPHCAVWIPPGEHHRVKGFGAIEGYCVLIEPEAGEGMPPTACTLSTTPLLRELIMRCVTFEPFHAQSDRERRLIETLLDELRTAPVEQLHLPMPADARLRRLAEALANDPADRANMDVWARRAGVSVRTLDRLLRRQTGMSFGRWRQQAHIIFALERLAKGAAVKTVAAELGYESAGSFVTMFRKALGAPPARYIAETRAG